MTHEEVVLEYMKKHKGITSMEAYDKLGVTRLSAVIFNLRERYDILDVWETCTNRYGNKAKFKRYIFNGDKKAPSWKDLFRGVL